MRTARRDQIVQRAAALFDERGYHQTTMGDIATDVGLKKPTLYHHVTSKEEILFLIHEEFVDLLLAAQQERAAQTESPEELLLGTMADILRLMGTHRGHVRVFFEHHRELPKDLEVVISAKRDAYFEHVCDAIRRGVDDGVFVLPDVRLAALAMFGMCNWAYTWYRNDGPFDADDIGRWFWSWLVTGFRGVPADIAQHLPVGQAGPGKAS